jgi:hypothetical protein
LPGGNTNKEDEEGETVDNGWIDIRNLCKHYQHYFSNFFFLPIKTVRL